MGHLKLGPLIELTPLTITISPSQKKINIVKLSLYKFHNDNIFII